MERTEQGLEKALSEIPALYDEFKKDLRVTGDGDERQPDAREGRPRRRLLPARHADVPRRARAPRRAAAATSASEYQTEEGEALRDDENFAHVAAWEWTGDPMAARSRTASSSSSRSSTSQTRSYK